MGSRLLPYECPKHNVTMSYGDFGSCQGYCAESGHAPENCPDEPGCEECEAEAERERIARDQELLDLRRANRANKSRWKNARRDFLAVRVERDELRAEVEALRSLIRTAVEVGALDELGFRYDGYSISLLPGEWNGVIARARGGES